MEVDFDIFDELTEEERTEIEKRRIAWKTENAYRNSIDGRRKQFLKTFLQHQSAFDSVVSKLPCVFTERECQQILDRYLNGEWFTNRHSAFPTTDKSLYDDIGIMEYIKNRVLPQIARAYGFLQNDLEILDLFLVKYTSEGQKELKVHTDGCLISFNILLNDNTDFVGGGTVFPDFNKVIQCKRGDCLVHPGKLDHGGSPITAGKRFLLVGFVETVRKGELSKKNILLKSLRNFDSSGQL